MSLCQITNKRQTATIMAAVLLSTKKFDKIIRNHVKFAKFSTNNQSVILNKPYLNLICKQCAVTSYYKVTNLYLNMVDYFHQCYWYFLVILIINTRHAIILCLPALLIFPSEQSKWFRLRQKCFSGRISKQTEDRKNTSW